MNTKMTPVPFSPAWKAFVADAIQKQPKDRTLEEREALALAGTDDGEGTPTMHFGIRCERDGTGTLPAAVAWYREKDKTQRFATLAVAQQMAETLNIHSPPCLHYEARAFVLGLDKEAKLSDAAFAEASKLWAREHIGLAEAVLKAQAFAAVETERVNKYINPIFAEFEFSDPDGKKIVDLDDLYLSNDEAKVVEFWARCDLAHRENGFRGELGVWPNRQAEHLRMLAEKGLVTSFCDFIGLRQPWGKKFQQLLKLLLAACLAIKSGSK